MTDDNACTNPDHTDQEPHEHLSRGFLQCDTHGAGDHATADCPALRPALAANHIHADYWDVVSPLRIAQLRVADGRPLRIPDGNPYTITPDSGAHMMLTGLEHRAENQGDNRFDDAADAILDLDATDIMLLSVCLSEAIRTAYDDRMPRCAQRMEELLHELDSGRKPTVLVLGSCRACWPNNRRIQDSRHLATLEEEASLANMHADNPHTAIFNALED